MWKTQEDADKAAAMLDNFGATHFVIQRDGTVYAVVQSVSFPMEGEYPSWGVSDADEARAAISKASSLPVLPPM